MQRAIELGQQARYWSAPNPPVGCILVRDDQEIGAGFTQPAGQAHAEVMALNAAGDANLHLELRMPRRTSEPAVGPFV